MHGHACLLSRRVFLKTLDGCLPKENLSIGQRLQRFHTHFSFLPFSTSSDFSVVAAVSAGFVDDPAFGFTALLGFAAMGASFNGPLLQVWRPALADLVPGIVVA